MKPVEILTLAVAMAAIGAVLVRDRMDLGWPVLAALFAVAAGLGALQIFGAPFRWQMLAAYGLILAGVAMLAFDLRPEGWARGAGAALALAVGTLTVLFAAGFPHRTLPEPGGPYAVGVAMTALTRASEAGHRPLTVKLWYPAAAGATGEREAMWPEFRAAPTPAAIRLMARYLAAAETHAVKHAPLAEGGPYPLILYHHGLVSIPSETSLLMAALASHGYVVASVSHDDQMAEYRHIQQAVPADERERDKALQTQLRAKGLSREDRARLMAEMFANSTGTPRIVAARAADSAYVLDRLGEILAAVPDSGAEAVDPARIGALGLSVGGAAATRLCRDDARCRAAVNMDGGLYGDPLTTPVPVPYLMLYSAANDGANDALAKGEGFEEAMAPGTQHMDFHDGTLMWPLLKWIGALGPVDGEAMIAWRNERVVGFFDRALKP